MLEKIRRIAKEVREECVGSSPLNKCWEASWRLYHALQDVPGIRVVNGTFLVEGEYGERPHYWVEWNGRIIDVTADQFNDLILEKLPRVHITDADSGYYVKNKICHDEEEIF